MKNILTFATIAEAEKQLLKLNLEKAQGKLKNLSQIGKTRQEIARMKTKESLTPIINKEIKSK